MDKENIADWLRASAAFKDAPEEAIVELTGAFTERPVNAGQAVVCEGDSGGEFFLLASGSLTVAAGKGGEEKYLGNISTGDTFGEIASLTGGRRLASVTAAEDSLLLALPQEAFQSTVHKYPGLAEAVLRSLERYLLP
jgi:CRP-like cAMP-binding protein